MKIRNTELRLKPGDCSTFFKDNPELYVELRVGKVITIPNEFSKEILDLFGSSIEVIKENKKKSKIEPVVDEETNNG